MAKENEAIARWQRSIESLLVDLMEREPLSHIQAPSSGRRPISLHPPIVGISDEWLAWQTDGREQVARLMAAPPSKRVPAAVMQRLERMIEQTLGRLNPPSNAERAADDAAWERLRLKGRRP